MSEVDANGIEIQDCYVICCNCEHKQFLEDVIVGKRGNLVFCIKKDRNVEQIDRCDLFQCKDCLVERYKVQ